MRALIFGLLILLASTPAAHAGDIVSQLERIKAVNKEGKGNTDAARAWRELCQQGPEALIDILTALDDANPTAANWLRGAVDSIAERTQRAGQPLPTAKLEAFVLDRKHAGRARRLAYDWLVKADKSAPVRLLPGMLNDPAAELRRDAVAAFLEDARKLAEREDRSAAVAQYKKALQFARDIDQVKLVAERLKKLGTEIDLTSQLGFLTHWMIVGPFDNSGEKGFHIVYPPERGVDLKATYVGKDSKEIRWHEYESTQALGVVDCKKVVGDLQGAIAYAFTAVESKIEQSVEIRCASGPAIRIYLNGKEIYAREEYHHGVELDQHIGKGTLQAGRNEILVKVCNNELKEDREEPWAFQLRICDELGTPVATKRIVP